MGAGRPKAEAESIQISGKISCKEACYDFVKAKLAKISKTELLLEAINALWAVETGEIYARYFVQVIEQLKMQPSVMGAIDENLLPLTEAIPALEAEKPSVEESARSLDDYSDDELMGLMNILHTNNR